MPAPDPLTIMAALRLASGLVPVLVEAFEAATGGRDLTPEQLDAYQRASHLQKAATDAHLDAIDARKGVSTRA